MQMVRYEIRFSVLDDVRSTELSLEYPYRRRCLTPDH
jgi:hypothetical protein